jgi:arginine/lysine/histidine transport system ATP-binding protein
MLNVLNLAKSFQGIPVLKDISFQLQEGTVAALLGPSGSGKSTLLRCISRLEAWEQGGITFQGQELSGLSSSSIGMVFQSFHLFPHMTVLQNLMYAAIRVKGMPTTVAQREAMILLEKFNLADKAKYFPNALSGGQKQRVAIARALMMDPPLLLFDEPTSALDPEMVSDVAALIQGLKSPDRLIILATHELRAAKLAADQVLFLDHGVLVENAPNKDFFLHPKAERAQRFLKNMMI